MRPERGERGPRREGGGERGERGPKPEGRGERGDRGDRGDRKGGGEKFGGKPKGKGKPKFDDAKKGARSFEAHPPKKEKPIDPDSPFAVLAALKGKK